MRMERGPAVLASRTDYYQVLGVPRDAPHGVIRDAFVRLSRRHHPDHAGDLPGRLGEVQQAYHCLSNTATRAEHDLILQIAERAHHRRQRAVLRRLRGYDRGRVASTSRVSRHRRSWLALALLIGLVSAAVLLQPSA